MKICKIGYNPDGDNPCMSLTPTFIAAVNTLINGPEKGYVSNPADRGGPTNYGITKSLARMYGWQGDMKDLPRPLAETIYQVEFWERLHCEEISTINYPIAYELFDAAVNCGPFNAAHWLQRALNFLNRCGKSWPNIEQDSNIGSVTIATLAKAIASDHNAHYILIIYAMLRANSYLRIIKKDETQETFLRGWLNRLDFDKVSLP